MGKRSACLFLALLSLFPLTGCWDYRGLNEMTIVTGMAIDKSQESGKYLLTCEFVDLSAPVKEKGYKGRLVQSEGETLFEAVRNAKRRLANLLYFGHNQIVILSKDIASEENIISTVDWLLRDVECRETLYVAVSQGETAHEVFEVKGIDQKLISHKLQMVIRGDEDATGSTLPVELYELYDIAEAPGVELALPAVRRTKAGGELVTEINGLALFDKEKLVGFLSPTEAKYYLFAIDRFEKGILPFHDPESGEAGGTLKVSKCSTKYEIKVDGENLKLIVKPELTVYLDELMESGMKLDEAKLEEIQAAAAKELEEKISDVIRKIQNEFGSDVLGYGNLIYRRDYPLWTKLEAGWEERFPTLETEVRVDMTISNSALLTGG